MKRTDDIRAALREAAEFVAEGLSGQTNKERWRREALARRLRGLARRMRDWPVVEGETRCSFSHKDSWERALCNLSGERCYDGEAHNCPLSRGPIVVRRAT